MGEVSRVMCALTAPIRGPTLQHDSDEQVRACGRGESVAELGSGISRRTALQVLYRDISLQITSPRRQRPLIWRSRSKLKILNGRSKFHQRIFSPSRLHERQSKGHACVGVYACRNGDHWIASLSSDLISLPNIWWHYQGIQFRPIWSHRKSSIDASLTRAGLAEMKCFPVSLVRYALRLQTREEAILARVKSRDPQRPWISTFTSVVVVIVGHNIFKRSDMCVVQLGKV